MITVNHPARMASGVYLGLDETLYHQAFALSSHGVRHLQTSTLDYWMHTPALNPRYQELVTETETEAQLIGRAYDTRIIMGHEAFDAQFAAKLDQKDFPGSRRTMAEIIEAIKAAGGPERGYSGKNKPELVAMLLQYDPEAQIWDHLVAAHEATHAGKTMLPAPIVERIEIAASMIEHHPQLCKAFTEGVPQPSIFWEDPQTGVPMKARMDYWKPLVIVDLKSFDPMGRPLETGIARSFVNYRYDLQAALYLRAWEQAKRLIREDKLFGGDDPAILEEHLLANEMTFLFVWQAKGPAPVAIGKILPAQSGTLYIANSEIDTAIRQWAECWERYGTDPWRDERPISAWSDEDFPFRMR